MDGQLKGNGVDVHKIGFFELLVAGEFEHARWMQYLCCP
jgi:hypothetical protein